MNRLHPWLLVALLALAGCAGVTTRGPQPLLDPLRQSAEDLAAQNDYAAAAQLYLSHSQTAPANQVPELRLQAAEYLARGQLWEPLGSVLLNTATGTLTSEQQARYQILLAELALADGRSDAALAHLQTVTNPENLPDRGQHYYVLRAAAYSAAGNPLEAAHQLIWLDGLLAADPQPRLANQYRIWEQLSVLSDAMLQQLLAATSSEQLRGWMDLTLTARRTRGDLQQWQQQLQGWRMRYPEHAADAALLPDMAGQTLQAGASANHIAVLLPLSGRNGDAAAAIRDGLLAAYYSDPQQRPELRFYDTAGEPAQVWSLYQRAVQDGAERVIGPLLKESIEQLAAAGELAVPVLALNNIETSPTGAAALYQFGLSPEDEANQAAERMYRDGHRGAITLVPDTTWGQRVVTAFTTRFQALGGSVLDGARYTPDSADFRTPIQQTLNLDGSISRRRALEKLFGQSLHYEPRRRQDTDAIFVLAYPEKARLIYPQLKFHHAGDLPVYSTSHVFSTSVNRQLDRDINGLLFCDMPWILDHQGEPAELRRRLATIWPERDSLHPRLFALGVDAYRVLPWLEALQRPGFAVFPGATGMLSIDANRQLRRTLEWAQFSDGEPRKLEQPLSTGSMEGQDESSQNAWRAR